MTVRPAGPGDIDEIVRLLHDKMDPRISPDRWRRLFSYPWLDDKPDLGRVAVMGGKIVGYLGAIYSDRVIDGKKQRIVNPAAWYLDKSARREGSGLAPGLGLEMMRDLVRDDGRPYFINTSSRLTIGLLRRVGFKVLDPAKYVWRRTGPDDGALERITIPDELENHLTDTERQMLSDHAGLPVTPVVFRTAERRLLLVLSVNNKADGARWFDVFHASDRAFLAERGQAIANNLLANDTMVFACDTRFCPTVPAHATRVNLKVARYFKPASRPAPFFDHLYTEIPLLGQKIS